MPMMNPSLPLVASSLALLLSGCLVEEQGQVAASQTGALLEPPAVRGDTLAFSVEGCGQPLRDGRALARQPYVQLVDADSASVLWTENAAHDFLVWRPGETPREVGSRIEETTFLGADRAQRQVDLRGLEPGALHCYALRDEDGALLGPFGFRTAPASADSEIDVMVFGDSGRGFPDQYVLADQMLTAPVDLIIHTGDIAYPNGTLQEFEDYTFDVYADLFSSIPFVPASGNHDYGTANAGPYREVFALPENGGERGHERWFSFDWGPAHFVALDTEVNGSDQIAWLAEDLARADRPWNIVYAHRPPYSSGPHGGDGGFEARYGDILREHGVKLVLTGHDHHYERFHPIDGITYVVTGGGGAGTRTVAPGPLTAFAESVTHFVTLHVSPDEIRVHAIDAVGREFDGARIAR